MTMATRRRVVMGGTVLAGGALAAACGAPRGGARPANTLAPANLVFLDPDGAALGDTKQAATAEFAGRFPGVKAERVFGDGSATFDKIQTMIAGGTQLDVFWSWGYWKNAMAARGTLVAFDDFLRKEPKDSYTKTWSPGAVESTKYQGKTYGYVTQIGVPGLLVNEELFKQAGVPLPPRGYKDQTWTLDRLLEAARKITRRSGDTPEVYGSTPWGTWWAGFNWITETFGGTTFNAGWTDCLMDRPEVIQAQQWAADLRLTHRVAPTSAEGKDGTFDFPNGKVGIRLGWLHQPIATVKKVGDSFKWNIYPLPKGVKQTAAGAAYNWYCLLKDSKYQDQARAFIHYMAGPEIVGRYLATADSFPFMSAGQEAFLRDLPQLNKEVVAPEGMALIKPQPNLPKDPDIQKVVSTEITPAFEGQRAMKDALAAAAQQIRLLLKA
jgi:ABC-type glycerol-3-phosphate transport system substrate-binding protein